MRPHFTSASVLTSTSVLSLRMEADLNAWGALGTQFLRLLDLTMKEDAWESLYPLEMLDAAERADVFVNAAKLLDDAPVHVTEGRVRCDADARSFFAFLHRQSVPTADYPFCSFSDSELELLIMRSWLSVGPSGDRLKVRLLQLVNATCQLRKSAADLLGRDDLHVERYVWQPGAYATDGDINDALCVFGLPPREPRDDQSVWPPSKLSDAFRLAGVRFPPRATGSSLSPCVELAIRVQPQPASPPRLRSGLTAEEPCY